MSPLVEIVGADSSGVAESSTMLVVSPSCKGSVGDDSLWVGAPLFGGWFALCGLALADGFGRTRRGGSSTKCDLSFRTSKAVAKSSNMKVNVANAYFQAWRRMSNRPVKIGQAPERAIEVRSAKLSCRAFETCSFVSRSMVNKNRCRN